MVHSWTLEGLSSLNYNDPHLEHKVIKIDREFHENESYMRWWPYLDRLKEILPTIEPKYNI